MTINPGCSRDRVRLKLERRRRVHDPEASDAGQLLNKERQQIELLRLVVALKGALQRDGSLGGNLVDLDRSGSEAGQSAREQELVGYVPSPIRCLG